jgi:hypothetical protein
MNSDRIRAALKRIHTSIDASQYVDGLLGRLNPSGPPTFVPRGMSRHKFVRINNSDGAQSVVRARDDVGVPESAGLPVRLRIVHNVPNSGVQQYVIHSILRDESMAIVPAPPGSGVPTHAHSALYYNKTEFINASAGVTDAGKPIKTDAGGLLDASLIDPEDIADTVGAMVSGNTETDIAVTYQDSDNTLDFVVSSTLVGDRIHAATGKTTPVDADELGLADSAASFVLKKLTWATLKATVKTYYDSVAATLTN